MYDSRLLPSSQNGMGFVPGVVALATKAGDIGSAVSGFTNGISGLFGDTPTDKRRKADAAANLQAALQGSSVALRRLLYEAFEKRGSFADDTRTPSDGKYSPNAVRDLAKKALKSYVSAVGGLPPEFAAYASKLGTQPLSAQSVKEAIALFPGAPLQPGPAVAPGAAPLPSWALPVGAAVGGLLLLALVSRRK